MHIYTRPKVKGSSCDANAVDYYKTSKLWQAARFKRLHAVLRK